MLLASCVPLTMTGYELPAVLPLHKRVADPTAKPPAKRLTRLQSRRTMETAATAKPTALKTTADPTGLHNPQRRGRQRQEQEAKI